MRRDALRNGLQQRLTSGLHLGRLRPGERLGSARQTAREVGSDYRAVVTALRGLERDGLLEIRPRGGLYAGSRPARSRSRCPAGDADRVIAFILEELAGDVQVAAVAERLRHCLDTAGLRAACIECNRDQLDFLCEELQTAFGIESTAVEVERLRSVPLPVRQAHLLVSTSFHAGEVRRCAARLGKACVIVTLDPRRVVEVTRLLAERPVCFVGTDPRWAAKAQVIWGGEPGAERLRTLTLGQDSLDDIPAEAAVLLMPPARRLLAGHPLVERAMPHRGFSHETTRQILSFVVHANAVAATVAHGR